MCLSFRLCSILRVTQSLEYRAHRLLLRRGKSCVFILLFNSSKCVSCILQRQRGIFVSIAPDKFSLSFSLSPRYQNNLARLYHPHIYVYYIFLPQRPFAKTIGGSLRRGTGFCDVQSSAAKNKISFFFVFLSPLLSVLLSFSLSLFLSLFCPSPFSCPSSVCLSSLLFNFPRLRSASDALRLGRSKEGTTPHRRGARSISRCSISTITDRSSTAGFLPSSSRDPAKSQSPEHRSGL